MFNDTKTRHDRLGKEDINFFQAILASVITLALGYPVLYFVMAITN